MDQAYFKVRFFLIGLCAVMVFGTIGFMFIESLSLADAFYFSIVTIATVGYGDIHPLTQTGKIFAVLLIITGVGTFLGMVATATELMLSKRELKIRLEKLNMVIGAFFSEVGTSLLLDFSRLDAGKDTLRKDLVITNDWTDADFLNARKNLLKDDFRIVIDRADLEELRSFLLGKRGFLLRLLENPVLLEHESFTDLLRAVFHLCEELTIRSHIKSLPDSDRAHLSNDMQRVYSRLVIQWLDYMRYLKYNYPYLFSLSVRTNPFDRDASPVVK